MTKTFASRIRRKSKSVWRKSLKLNCSLGRKSIGIRKIGVVSFKPSLKA